MNSFEEFLGEKCPSELQTNNSPEGEDNWVERLDVQELINFAEEYGEVMYKKGMKDLAYDVMPEVNKLGIALDASLRTINGDLDPVAVNELIEKN
jgi:hypothetical protein